MARGNEVKPEDAVGMASWLEAARCGDVEALGRALEPFRDYLLLVANEELEPRPENQGWGFRPGPGDLSRRSSRSPLVSRPIGIGVASLAPGHSRSFSGEPSPSLPLHRKTSSRAARCPSRIRPTSTGHRTAQHRVRTWPGVKSKPRFGRLWIVWPSTTAMWSSGIIGIGCTFEEVGQRLGISAEAARKLWERALKALRKELRASHGCF